MLFRSGTAIKQADRLDARCRLGSAILAAAVPVGHFLVFHALPAGGLPSRLFHRRLVAGFIATTELIFFTAAAGTFIVAPDFGRIAAYRADAALGTPEIVDVGDGLRQIVLAIGEHLLAFLAFRPGFAMLARGAFGFTGEHHQRKQTFIEIGDLLIIFLAVYDGLPGDRRSCQTPRLFSFNSPFGACPDCAGLGSHEHFSEELEIGRAHV